MYFFDSSIWIDFLKNVQTNKANFLELTLSNEEIASCPTLFQEILQGIRDQKQYNEIYSLLYISTKKIEADPYEVAVGAAHIYRTLRSKGLSIRKPNDCLIAWYCMENNLDLVHNDSDFKMIAKHFPLRTWEG